MSRCTRKRAGICRNYHSVMAKPKPLTDAIHSYELCKKLKCSYLQFRISETRRDQKTESSRRTSRSHRRNCEGGAHDAQRYHRVHLTVHCTYFVIRKLKNSAWYEKTRELSQYSAVKLHFRNW